MIHKSILDIIGATPLVRLNKVVEGLPCTIAAKLEYLNPGGSVKDRIGPAMIRDAEERGLLKPGGTIIEATSGNTGMGLALAAVNSGYDMVFTMPDKMSHEKIDLLKAFGAKVIVTPTAVEADDPRSYNSVAKRLAKEIPGAYFPDQFSNPVNPETHYRTTGPEIWEQTAGKIDALVGGMGTGGTMAGCGRFLKEKNPDIRIVAADPVGSIYCSMVKTGKPGDFESYKVEGIGEDIIPSTADLDVIDDVISVTDKNSFNMARTLARQEGIFVGGSGGAAVVAALEAAKEMGPDQLVVVVLSDTGRSYISKCYSDDWMQENQFLEEAVRQTAFEILMAKQNSSEGCVTIGPEAMMSEALATMRKLEISQIPVVHGGENLGVIKEEKTIDLLIQHSDLDQIAVKDAMEPPLPEVDLYEDVQNISSLFTRGTPGVLVNRGEGTYSIITKFDLLHARR